MPKLTDRYLRSLKPRETRYRIGDATCPGLELTVLPSGTKSFRWRTKIDGRTTFRALGHFPEEISLADARAAAFRLREARRHGELGLPVQGDQPEPAEITVRALAKEWRDRYLKASRKTWQESWRLLEKDLLPVLGDRPASAIRPRDIVRLCDAVVDRGAAVAANRLYSNTRQLFDFAVARGILEVSPAASLKRPTRDEPARERVLRDDELRTLWERIPDAAMVAPLQILLRLLLVTGQRRGELTMARWGEFDLDAATWSIPAEHTKNGKAHVVPLSRLALDLLAELHALTGLTEWLFPSPRGGAIRPHAVSRAVRNNRGHFGLEAFTPHDLRRTVRTNLARLGVDHLVSRKVLNQSLGGMDRIYDRHHYDDEKRAALGEWAAHLQAVIDGTANVVEIATALGLE